MRIGLNVGSEDVVGVERGVVEGLVEPFGGDTLEAAVRGLEVEVLSVGGDFELVGVDVGGFGAEFEEGAFGGDGDD